MRQGFAVTGLLLLIGLPTVLIAEGGWRGVQQDWIDPAVHFVAERGWMWHSAALVSTRTAARSDTQVGIGHEVTGSAAASARVLSTKTAGNLFLTTRPSIDPFLVRPNSALVPVAAASEARLAADIKDAAAATEKAGAAITDAVRPRDLGSAYLWYTLAANPDNAEARYGIARDYLNRPVGSDLANAVRWLISAADLGHARAQFDIGEMYIEGTGVTRNYPAAFKWLTLAQSGLIDGDLLASTADKLARLSRAMTPEELAEASAMITEWHPKTFASPAPPSPTMIASGN